MSADARRLGAEALRSDAIDQSLLLAAAGVSLEDSVDTRTNLLATLDRAPALVSSARSAGRIFHMSVNAATDQLAVMAADGVGLELYDGPTLRRVPVPENLIGGSVVARPDGQGFAATISGDLVEDGVEPPVLLLDRNGARSRSSSVASRRGTTSSTWASPAAGTWGTPPPVAGSRCPWSACPRTGAPSRSSGTWSPQAGQWPP